MNKRWYANASFFILTLGLALLFGAWRIHSLLPFGWHIDEGSYLFSTFWLSKGYSLYSQIPILGYPIFVEFLGNIFVILQPTIHTARITIVALGVMYVIITAMTGRHVASWLGGIVSAFALLVDRELFDTAGLVLSEIPALAVMSVSVAFTLLYLTSGKRIYLCGAALACAISLLVKPGFFLMPLWIGGIILLSNLWGGSSFRKSRLVLDSLAALGLFIFPFVLCLFVYDIGDFVHYSFLARVGSRQLQDWSLGMNIQIVLEYLSGNLGFFILALAGLPLISLRNLRVFRFAVSLWALFVLILVGLLWYAPLNVRHCVLLSCPISLLAGMSINSLLRWRITNWRSITYIISVLVACASLYLIVINAPTLVAWRNSPNKFPQGGSEVEAIHILERITSPTEYIASDDLGMTFIYNRRVPPELSDVSHARIRVGLLTDADVIRSVKEHDIQTVVIWTERFRRLKTFVRWAHSNFVGQVDLGEGRYILHGRLYKNKDEILHLTSFPEVRLGDSIALIGYRIESNTLKPEEQARLILYWEPFEQVHQDYQIFVHLLDAEGKIVSQTDGAPVNGLYPTSKWVSNQIIADVHHLPIPQDVQLQKCRLLVGMYELDSLKRLPVTDPASSELLGDFLELSLAEMSSR